MDSKSLARYQSALRRYKGKPITQPKTKATTTKSGYEKAKYLGFDTLTGKHQFETNSGIKSSTSLSNNPIPLDGYGLYAQGFSINPYG